ncbi:MAG: hypothetical protein LBB82_05000, partial [Treponema sp.]|nr:hypothetical protein [Treponema sp.]
MKKQRTKRGGCGKSVGTALLTAALVLGTACNSQAVNKDTADSAKDPPVITSASYQHTLYNGQPQPVEARTAAADAPPLVVTYFRSEADFLSGAGGTKEIPVNVGSYYARIERPAGNGYREGPPVKVEYYIQKTFFPLNAEERQEFVYDGTPKPVIVSAPADITITYYSAGGGAQKLLAGPPVERGSYRALLSYAGGEHY